MMRRLTVLTMVLAAVAGCDASKETDTSKPSRFGFQTDIPTSLIEEGKVAYARYCVGCHGANGDGAGEASKFLNPKPRNFALANFKFSSTRSGQLPTDADLKHVLRGGLRGSAMPNFNLLPERTVDGLIAYIKTFSPKWAERGPGAPVPIVDDPWRTSEDKSEAIARGEAVYHGYSTCWSCHPAYVPETKINEHLVKFGRPVREGFRPGLNHSEGKPNGEGELVYPPDFKRDFVRAGVTVNDLYRSIAAGITGTAMPTWVDSIDVPGKNPGDPPMVSKTDLWAMAYYVQSLIAQRPALLAQGQFEVRNRPRPIYLNGPPPGATGAPETPAEPATTQPADFGF